MAALIVVSILGSLMGRALVVESLEETLADLPAWQRERVIRALRRAPG